MPSGHLGNYTSLTDLTDEKAAAPREEEGRRRGTLAQGGERAAFGVQQGQGREGHCRKRSDP
jgi:hypothetical protein